MLVLLVAAAAGVTATAGWSFDQQRGQRRNDKGACGLCGVHWTDMSTGEPYLMHGRLVCALCAGKAKHRMAWHFGFLAAAVAMASSLIVAGGGVVGMVLFPVGSTIAMTLGAVRVMKFANRDAQWRILVGDFPPCRLLDAQEIAEPRQRLVKRPRK